MELAMIGLGTMGRNLLLNMGDHGFSVVGYDLDAAKRDALVSEANTRPIKPVASVAEMAATLRKPRVAMMLVPAGKPVDAVIADLLPHFEPGDIIIDGGNSHFTDTDRRVAELAPKGIHFLGIGISGGERGARLGPSIMPGGNKEAYERVRPIFESVAAKVNDEPCVTHLGPGSAGHYVKMVHNGIEYGVMQLIAESYDFLKRVAGLNNQELHATYSAWNAAELNGFLMEITALIFGVKDPAASDSGKLLVDMIRDAAKQKGTGMWTSQDAMDMGVAIPTIDGAVTMRFISTQKSLREKIAAKFPQTAQGSTAGAAAGDKAKLTQTAREALYASIILTYAQGMAQLAQASQTHSFNLDLAAIARIWRGGCIIRSTLLEPIRQAFAADSQLPNLLLDPKLGSEVATKQASLREMIIAAVRAGIPCAAHMDSLTYFDGWRAAQLPANLIQAQRDCFGSHTYERIDQPGTFHTPWEGALPERG